MECISNAHSVEKLLINILTYNASFFLKVLLFVAGTASVSQHGFLQWPCSAWGLLCAVWPVVDCQPI